MGQVALSMIHQEDESNNLSPDTEPKHDTLAASHSPVSTPDLSDLEDSYTMNSNESTAYTTSQYSKQHQAPMEKTVEQPVLCLQSSPADGLESDIQQKQSWPGCNPGVIHLPSLQRDMYPPLYSLYRRTTGDLSLPQTPLGVSTASTSSNFIVLLTKNDPNDASSCENDDDDDDGTSGVYYDAMEGPSEMVDFLTSTRSGNSLSPDNAPMRQSGDSIILSTHAAALSSSLFKDGPILELRKSFINDITSLSRTRPFVNNTIRSNISCDQQPIQQQQESALVCRKLNNEIPQPPLKVAETPNITNANSTETTHLARPRKILPLPASLRKRQNQQLRQSRVNLSASSLQTSLQQSMPTPAEITFKSSSMESEEKEINADTKIAPTKEHRQLKSDISINKIGKTCKNIDEEHALTDTSISNNENACNSIDSISTSRMSKGVLKVSPQMTCNISSTLSTPQHSPLVQSSSTEHELASNQPSPASLKKKKNEKHTISPLPFSKINNDNGAQGNEQLIYHFSGQERNVEHSGSQRSITRRKMINNENRNGDSLDLVTIPRNLNDDWVCLFCQYEIFQHGWVKAQREQAARKQQKKKRSGRRQVDSQHVAATSTNTSQGADKDIAS